MAALGDTKQHLLEALKDRGEARADELASELGITAIAVRQHLQDLQAAAVVAWEDRQEGRGRPRRYWRLAPAAEQHFPDAHAELGVDLLVSMRAVFGEEGVERIVDERGRRQLRAYRKRMPPSDAPLARRVKALAELREREGYRAIAEAQGDGSWLLRERHCPICTAAKACQGLCRNELELFRKSLGRSVQVEREQHIASGDQHCVYRITPARSTRR